MLMCWILLFVVLLGTATIPASIALALSNPSNLAARREFVEQVQASILGISASLSSSSGVTGKPATAFVEGVDDQFDKINSAFKATNLQWHTKDDYDVPVNWNRIRYGTSSLNDKSKVAPAEATLARFPTWLEGDWSTLFKFEEAKFPLGRDKLTLRVPGAGLGTCLSLPNIGYNPSKPFVSRFSAGAFEDVAYNTPRRFEAFWPHSKVTALQTRGPGGSMSPRCFVTGEGCTEKENPNFHSSASTRMNMQFEGPTRSSGLVSQAIDLSVVDQESAYCCHDGEVNIFVLRRNYVQFNAYQGINSFFQEYTWLSRRDDGTIHGRIRVAAFLPTPENSSVAMASQYDDSQAVAIYDYKVEMAAISKDEAATM